MPTNVKQMMEAANAAVSRITPDQAREMIAKGKRMALRHGFGTAGAKLIALAGVPFGTPGSTNLLHIVTLSGNELKRDGG